MTETVRVAAAQLAVGVDVDQNLQTCLRVVDEAVEACRPQLLVLPEFLNHLSWYEDPGHCHRVSVERDGPFLGALGDAARAHGLYLVANVTVRRGADGVTGTSFLFGPDGAVLAESDKQVLMGHENAFLRPARAPSPITPTPLGALGLYACMDGVICETPRALALRGAEILCNSLNSFALDEASLHVPVRAAENRCFVVAANKVGPLIPEPLLAPVGEATGIPARFLHGAGESQIVAPDGTVVAKASLDREEVIWADIDVADARHKLRPDGTNVFESRRPALYAPIGEPPAARAAPRLPRERVAVATIQPEGHGEVALDDACAAVARLAPEVRLAVLPELFYVKDARVDDLSRAEREGRAVVHALAEAGCDGLHVVTSVVDDGRHVGVVIGPDGVVFRQPQLHVTARHASWMHPGDRVEVLVLPWARLGLVVGDDALFPETARLLAIRGVEVVAAPVHVLEPWEVETGLRERSAENRVCLVAATRPSDAGTSRIYDLHEDFTLMTEWATRAFDGTISDPVITAAPNAPSITTAEISPGVTHNKLVSTSTDVVDGRPWQLVDAITKGRVG